MFITILIAFLSLIALIILHEFGHFILAKKFGVKVEEFGIGYPPSFLRKKIGETIYSLNLLPFGAFVKIKGEEGGVENYRSFIGLPMWQRISIVLGGVISFWLIAAILLSVVAGVWGLPTASGLAGPYSWYEAPLRGVIATANLTYSVVDGWILGLKSAFGLSQLPEGMKMDIMGPLGIFNLLSEYFSFGINYFLFLISLIAVALALTNLLPIPALDGGKLVFLIIESLRGKPINYKLEQKLTSAFFVLLIILMIFVTIKFDIPRIF